jgi:hypothetical protein
MWCRNDVPGIVLGVQYASAWLPIKKWLGNVWILDIVKLSQVWCRECLAVKQIRVIIGIPWGRITCVPSLVQLHMFLPKKMREVWRLYSKDYRSKLMCKTSFSKFLKLFLIVKCCSFLGIITCTQFIWITLSVVDSIDNGASHAVLSIVL